jgi:hypothetical protein
MQIVIDIPEEIYNYIHNEHISMRVCDGHKVARAIANGILLPKNHGRLIDADALEKKMCDREEELGDDRAMWESSAVSVALDMFAPTIIEADKENT